MDELKKLTGQKNYDKFDKKIANKQFLLGKFYDATINSLVSSQCKNNHVKKFPKSKIKKLLDVQLKIKEQLFSEKQQKNKNGKKQQPEAMNEYQFYMPLHNLWKQYITDLICKQQNQQAKQLKVLRSDFHGALITVVESKNQCLIGIQGLVIKQSLKSFLIITKENNIKKMGRKIILKSICIFLLQLDEKNKFIINGNSMVYRPSDRIKHKFKFKKADKINHDFLETLDEIRQEQIKQKQNQMDIQH